MQKNIDKRQAKDLNENAVFQEVHSKLMESNERVRCDLAEELFQSAKNAHDLYLAKPGRRKHNNEADDEVEELVNSLEQCVRFYEELCSQNPARQNRIIEMR